MVKIKIIKATNVLKEGEIVETGKDSAENMVQQGYAEYIKEEKPKKETTTKEEKIPIKYTLTICKIEYDNEYKEGAWEKLTIPERVIIYEKRKKEFETRKYKKEIEEEPPGILKYKVEGKFVPTLLTEDIKNETVFKTNIQTNQIYYYKNGIYHENGRNIIKMMAEEKTGGSITKYQTGEVFFHIEASTYVDSSTFDGNPRYIHLQNGIYDLIEHKLIDFDPKIISTIKLPIYYEPKQDCKKIKKFMSEIIKEEDIPILQETIGYCLKKSYEIQKAWMLVGGGNNGKSTFINLIKRFLGTQNIASVDLQSLNNHRFATAELHGKLANLYADLSDKALRSTGIFKMLTGGDTINAQKKFRHPFTFVNFAKLIFSTNKLPEVRDQSDAFFRRWIILNFPNQFDEKTADPKMLDKISMPDELSGLFNWSIEGLKRLEQQGHFSYTPTTDELREHYERLANSLSAFVMDHVEPIPDSYVAKDIFYLEFVKYCKKYNLPVKSKIAVGRELPEHVRVESSRKGSVGERKHSWVGIKLTYVLDVQDVIDFSYYYYIIPFSLPKLKVSKRLDIMDIYDMLCLAQNNFPKNFKEMYQLFLNFRRNYILENIKRALQEAKKLTTDELCEETDISEEDAQPFLDHLKEEGIIFSPKPDLWVLL